MHPLVTEAMKKAAIAWLDVAQRPAYPVWCLWVSDALYVVSGPGEQPAPDLAGATRAAVTARGDHGGRIVTWPALVERLDPTGETWAAIAPQLAAKRLNSGTVAELTSRWAQECVLSRLAPADDSILELPDGSLAAPPRPSPSVRATRKPWRLHRVKNPR